MDTIRFGSNIRALRQRQGLRQTDIAARARVCPSTVSRIERGQLEKLRVAELLRVAAALEAGFDLKLWWRGAELARVRDEAHAALVTECVGRLHASGWETVTEHTFAVGSERGSVDVLAWHASSKTLLIVEVKSTIVDLQDLFSSLNRKVRLVPRSVPGHLLPGGRSAPAQLGVLLVVPESGGARHTIARHRILFETTLPAGPIAVRRWLRAPEGGLRGIMFVPDVRPTTTRRRVRAARVAACARRRAGQSGAGD